jgi:hypothetical protein
MLNMKNMPRHTRIPLVCFAFICLSLILEPSLAVQESGGVGTIGNVKEFHNNFVHHSSPKQTLTNSQIYNNSDILENALHQTPSVAVFPPELMPRSPSEKETIVMNSTNSVKQVRKIYAMNTNIQREIVFDDVQSGDPMKKGLKNTMDIGISGNGGSPSKNKAWWDSELADEGIENAVDKAVSSDQHAGPVYYESHSGSPGSEHMGNYMNIDVSGIDVKAINTVEGGSAVATSNIVIQPVQIINCPPEVEEKLK